MDGDMVDLETGLLSFLLGVIGSILGGTQAFIGVGFAGIMVFVLKAAGMESTFLTDMLLGKVLLPCIVFNAATVSSAYAAHRGYAIKGWDVSHSLLFTHDPLVFLVSGIGGLAGYLAYAAASVLGIPADAGAISILVVGFATRFLFGKGHWLNHNANEYYCTQGVRYWVFQIICSISVCGVTAVVLEQAGSAYYTIGLYISALLLLLQTVDRDSLTYPTTHHMTLTVGYGLMATGNIAVAILFGVASNILYLLFARYFNEGCDTHIDPPSVAILVCSLILFTAF